MDSKSNFVESYCKEVKVVVVVICCSVHSRRFSRIDQMTVATYCTSGVPKMTMNTLVATLYVAAARYEM